MVVLLSSQQKEIHEDAQIPDTCVYKPELNTSTQILVASSIDDQSPPRIQPWMPHRATSGGPRPACPDLSSKALVLPPAIQRLELQAQS